MASDQSLPAELGSPAEVLSFAIAEELRAAQRYRSLAERVAKPELAEVLCAIASEEDEHRDRLEAVAAGDLSALGIRRLASPPDAEVAAVREPGEDASLAQVLLYAINAEHDAFRLYTGLAAAATDPGLTTLFRALAAQEVSHRTRLDRLYHEVAFGRA